MFPFVECRIYYESLGIFPQIRIPFKQFYENFEQVILVLFWLFWS